MTLDIALPHEQSREQNRCLMQDYVRERIQRKGHAAQFAIHLPDRDGDARNIHAHVLATLRKTDEHGFARTKAEQQERYRNHGDYVEGLRDSWERLANRHLERNGHDAWIDRRSLAGHGIEREPQRHRGPAVTAMERESNVTHIGDLVSGIVFMAWPPSDRLGEPSRDKIRPSNESAKYLAWPGFSGNLRSANRTAVIAGLEFRAEMGSSFQK
jgi:hypothetical protein